jgi:hypothetical protein
MQPVERAERVGGEDAEGEQLFRLFACLAILALASLAPMPARPDARERDHIGVAHPNQMRQLGFTLALPLVEPGRRHQTAVALEGRAIRRLVGHRLAAGVDHAIADLGIIGPMRHEPPAHRADDAALGFEPHDRQRLGGGVVVTGPKLARDRGGEDGFELGGVDGELVASTHADIDDTGVARVTTASGR